MNEYSSCETDADRVARALTGDREAFASLVRLYWGRLQRWLQGLTGSAEQSEDLTQEAFLRAWRGLGTFRLGSDFRVWLFGIARNAWIDSRKGPRPRLVEGLIEEMAGRDEDPQVLAQEREDLARFETACARLSEHYREPFLLWTQEGLSFAEIAEICGVAEPTARWRVFKARHLLVEMLIDRTSETLR